MAAPKPNTAIIDGVRGFYEHAGHLFAVELPGTNWPPFDQLTAPQLKAWMLAYAATIEVATRTTEAFASLDLEQP